jgi:hypothetical protein
MDMFELPPRPRTDALSPAPKYVRPPLKLALSTVTMSKKLTTPSMFTSPMSTGWTIVWLAPSGVRALVMTPASWALASPPNSSICGRN